MFNPNLIPRDSKIVKLTKNFTNIRSLILDSILFILIFAGIGFILLQIKNHCNTNNNLITIGNYKVPQELEKQNITSEALSNMLKENFNLINKYDYCIGSSENGIFKF